MRNKLRKLMMLTTAACLVSTSVMGVSAATLEDCFDADYYVSSYADLEEALGSDRAALFKHFKEYGIEEGRQANRYFDVKVYRERYADLDAAFGDDWDAYYDHYLTYGLFEGRSALASGEVFDAKTYAELYPDLKEAFGDDVLAYYMHYVTFGISEGRVFSKPAEASSGSADNAADTSVDNDSTNTPAEDSNVDNTVVPDDSVSSGMEELSFEEWVEALYQGLVQDDYVTVLALLDTFDSRKDECAAYEYVEWAQWDNEAAYDLTASDGTTVGIVVYWDKNGSINSIAAFVAYGEDRGFEYIDPGDHYVDKRAGGYSYLVGDVYYDVDAAGNINVMDMDNATLVVWHM